VRIDNKLDYISSKVNEMTCYIDESTIIIQPSVYCLANHLNCCIVIDSDYLALDLSGYRVSSENT